MACDAAFFTAYNEYLVEPGVRANHDRVFKDWLKRTDPAIFNVVDLGCGAGEFFRHGYWWHYLGIDKQPRFPPVPGQTVTFAADYLDIDHWVAKMKFKPNAFVSLFSVELVMAPAARYDFYSRLFDAIPTLKYGLSAGFYYTHCAHQPSVTEAGDIVSHQTIELLGEPNCNVPGVSEERLVFRNPSNMFGQNVVEVWKYFTRL